MIGQILDGRYKVTAPLGSGSFGQTYLAEDTKRPGHPKCVVKQLQPADPQYLHDARRLFETEAQTLEKLGEHPQIPRLLAHFEYDGEFYIVQEFIDGHPLREEIVPGQPLTETQAIDLLSEVLNVLSFVHDHKVIHRDINPNNIIRRHQDNKLVLIDFGAVKLVTTGGANTQGQVAQTITIGTPGYMPPEQINGYPELYSDIYAVGMLGVQALTGIHPHQLPRDTHTHEIIWRNQAQVSPSLAEILDKMVFFNSSQRYPEASEALQAVRVLKNSLLSTMPSPPPPSPTPPTRQSGTPTSGRSTRRNKIAKIAFFVVSAVSFLGGMISCTVAVIEVPEVRKFFGWDPTVPKTFLTYESARNNISIDYPESWKINDIGDPFGTFVKFQPRESSGPCQETISISVKPTTAEFNTLDKYTQYQLYDLKQGRTIASSKSSFLSARPAHEVVYTGQHGNVDCQWREIWTIRNDRAYIINYSAPPRQFDNFSETLQDIIRSFKFGR